MDKLLDVKNTFIQHLIVGAFSLGSSLLLNFYGAEWSTAFGRVSFFLLFFTLIIGPLMRLKKPEKITSLLEAPWSWRGELGIWFTITGVIHAFFAMNGSWSITQALGGGIGGGGYGLANLMGFIALFWALILTATSFNKAIKFLGIESWKWIQRFTYVIFYLVTLHLIYFQFFSTLGSGPDWFGYISVGMAINVVILQFLGFAKTVRDNRQGSA